MHKLIKIGLIMGISLLQISCSVFGIRSEETPSYKVTLADSNKEIRAYSSYIVAKTTIKGDFKSSQGDGFRLLAGYIFGNNEKQEKISMTAPVVQEKKTENEKIAMTAPVVQSATSDGWVMTFSMPSKYKMSDLPTPKDKRVILEEVPPKMMAVIKYTGFWSASKNNEMADELKAWINLKSDYEVVSGPGFAGYDPPWTIPFLRRNEMMFEIKPKK